MGNVSIAAMEKKTFVLGDDLKEFLEEHKGGVRELAFIEVAKNDWMLKVDYSYRDYYIESVGRGERLFSISKEIVKDEKKSKEFLDWIKENYGGEV